MRIAIAIPVRDGARHLPECLAAIDRQERAPDETWLVVAPSVDESLALAESAAADRAGVHVLENPEGDRGSALNLVIDRSAADAFAFVDAQSVLAPDYLAVALRVLAETDAAVVGGPMRPVGSTPIGEAMAAALGSPFGVGDSQFHFAGRAREVPSVYLGVYRADAFRRVGRYNTALLRTEDDDLNARIREAGLRIWLDPAIRSSYRCRDTLGEIWRQYHGYGLWKVALAAVRPGALRPRHMVPAAFVVALALAGAAALLGVWLPLAVLGGAWLVLAVAFAALAPAASVRVRLLFPLVTLTMHLAYGTGTLVGLLRLPSLAPRVRAAAIAAEASLAGGRR